MLDGTANLYKYLYVHTYTDAHKYNIIHIIYIYI